MSKIIEEIFEDYIFTDEYTESCNEYEKTHETFAKAYATYRDLIQSEVDQNKNEGLEKEDIISTVMVECEKRSFIQGFKLAMQLREECLKP